MPTPLDERVGEHTSRLNAWLIRNGLMNTWHTRMLNTPRGVQVFFGHTLEQASRKRDIAAARLRGTDL